MEKNMSSKSGEKGEEPNTQSLGIKHTQSEPMGTPTRNVRRTLPARLDAKQTGPPPAVLAPPPPLPPPPTHNDHASSDAPRSLTAKDLLTGKKNLKPVRYDNVEKVTVTRRNIYTDPLVSCSYFPLSVLESLVFPLQRRSEVVTVLNFSGIDQLTDFAFYVLLSGKPCVYVTKVILTGCFHITDQGVKWLAKAFPNLSEVNLEACHMVTEKSIFEILANCPEILYMFMKGTSVGNIYIPEALSKTRASVHVMGCPVLTPPTQTLAYAKEAIMTKGRYFSSLRDQDPFEAYKAVIITSESTAQYSLINLLSGKDSATTPHVQTVTNFRVRDSAASYNITQCSQVLAQLFLSERTVYLLPFYVTEKDSTMAKASSELVERIVYVLSQVPTAVFGIVPILDPDSGNCTDYAQKCESDVTEKMSKIESSVNKLITSCLWKLQVTTGETEIMYYKDQDRMGRLAGLMDAIAALQIQFSTTAVFPLSKDKASENVAVLSSLLQTCKELVEARHPWFGRFSEPLINLFQTVNQVEDFTAMSSDSAFVTGLRTRHSESLGQKFSNYHKSLQYLHMLGIVVHIPTRIYNNDKSESGLVSKDPEWFAETLNDVVNRCADQAANVRKDAGSQGQLAAWLATADASQEHDWKATMKNSGLLLNENTSACVACLPTEVPPNPYFAGYLTTREVEFLKSHNVYVMTYHFFHPLPPTVISQLAASTVVDCKLAWRDGVVLQNFPVEIMIRLVEQLATSSVIEVVGLIPGTTSKTRLEKTLRNEVQKYALVLDAILQAHRIGFEIKLKYNGLLTEPNPDTLLGTTTGCEFIERDSVMQCKACGVSQSDAEIFWELESHIEPAFSGEYDFKVSEKIRGMGVAEYVRGSQISTMANGVKLEITQPMDPVFFNSLQICYSGGGFGSIGISRMDHGVDRGVHIDENKNVQVGDTINITCNHGEDPDVWLVRFFINKGLVEQAQYDSGSRIIPVIDSKKSMGHFAVFASKVPILREPTTLEAGMRLEAKDKLNPSLICVATIQKVMGNDVLIHFDGWTAKYDYVTRMDDEELHPIGWFAQRGLKYPRLTNALQPPKGRRHHNWDDYLIEVNQWPVPYQLFTEAQTEGCEPYLVPNHVRMQLSGSSSDQCLAVSDRVGVLRTKLANFKEDVANDFFQSLTSSMPLAVILPSNLTAEQVKAPYMDMFIDENQASCTLYSLCPYYNLPHFMENASYELNSEEERKKTIELFSPFCIVTLCYLAKTKNFMPDKVDKIFPGMKDSKLTFLEVQKGLCTFFDLMLFGEVMEQFNKQTYRVDLQGKLNQRVEEAKSFLKVPKDASSVSCLCPAHEMMASNVLAVGGDKLDLSACQDYEHLIDQLILGSADDKKYDKFETNVSDEMRLTSLPVGIFKRFVNLTYINLAKHNISVLPDGIGECKKLQTVILCDNPISKLPDDFKECVDTLQQLDISNTKFSEIPEAVFEAKNLTILQANQTALTELPSAVGKLKNLSVLSLLSTGLTSLPEELAQCQELTYLRLGGIPWVHKTFLSLENLHEMYVQHPLLAAVPKHEREELFRRLDQGSKGYLGEKEIAALNGEIFKSWPRFENGRDEALGNLPACILSLKQLEVLHVEYQSLTKVPDGLGQLGKLEEISVAHNPLLQSVTPELCMLANLRHLNLNGCPSLKTPPKEIVSKGFRAVMGYLRRLQIGSVACKRTKLMMVGLGGAGKTSLVQELTASAEHGRRYGSWMLHDQEQTITDGIDIVNWPVKYGDDEVTYSVWDFAGQSVYYNTHQFFLSNRAVYMLLWNIRLGYEHAGLDFWLSSIACHAPKAPILVVGSHVDQVQKYWLPKEEIQRKYPQVKGFHAISCLYRTGIADLHSNLLKVTLQEKYMGENIPEAWLDFETKMTRGRGETEETSSNTNLLQWKEVEECAVHCGIYEKPEIVQAIGFLHDLGAVQHFHNEFLRNIVVINPQWIVDAMACVVNVRESPIQDGRLYHKDLHKIWKDYPDNMLQWLLRLTEEFDLTFPIPDEKCNIVPCLLPAEPPPYKWPNVEDTPGFKETKMQYVFDYLPAGLFNRVQVRLYQFSDSSVIWKKGSKLTKNGHHALMTIVGDREVVVKVQGYRPENILFLVHEVFEGLIAMSFHGVKYDYSIPCNDCLKSGSSGSHDPCMFSASKIRRASELKAPFLQCDKFFHTVTLTELHASMPPDQHSEFDLHLQRSIHELDDLHGDLTFDVFMVYATEDIPGFGEEEKKVAPRKIYDDLCHNDFKVWFTPDPSIIDLKTHAVTMRSARIALICISDAFVATRKMCDIFHFLKTNLQKTVQLVVLGASFEWKNSSIGMLISDDVFVNMMQPSRYPHKIKELVDSVRSKVSVYKELGGPAPAMCFISYCWSNSADAVKKGTRALKGSLGWGDPRTFKEVLEKEGISCWIDVDRVGQGGLFEEIADGLRQAKVVIACVSDEYAKSKNCQLEFRFANVVLSIPTVVAVVGTGYKWESTEVGMFSVGHPKVNFQHESTAAYDRLVAAVKQLLPDDTAEDKDESRTPSVSDNNQKAFQELLELAQRKFHRQVATIADRMETDVNYPRIFVLDFLTEDEKGEINLQLAHQLLEEKEEEDRKKTEEEKQEEETERRYIETEYGKEILADQLEKWKKKDEKIEEDKMEDGSKELRKVGVDHFQQNLLDGVSKLSKEVEKVEQEAVNKARPSLRPKSGLKKRSTVTGNQAAKAILDMLDDKKFEEVSTDMQYCIRFLCEHEEGWHCHGNILALPVMSQDELDRFTERAAPYMARLLAILKHSATDLQIVSSEKGAALRKRMEEQSGLEADFTDEYEDLRNSVIQLDKDLMRGSLKRCYLPSGKILWLCPKHQQEDDRITVFTEEDDGVFNDTYQKDNIQVDSLSRRISDNRTEPVSEYQPGTDQSNKPSDNKGVKEENSTEQVDKSPPKKAPLHRSQTREIAAQKLRGSGNEAGAAAAAKAASGKTGSKACSLM